MKFFTVSFAGSTVTIGFDTPEARNHLSLLFKDVSAGPETEQKQVRVALLFDKDRNEYLLQDGKTLLHRGPLGVQFAAQLYDRVIFHLLNRAETGIALHAGGLTCNSRTLLLPGQSGAGKSTLTAWLTSRQYAYLTDELIFISMAASEQVDYFRRPLCLKTGSAKLIESLLKSGDNGDKEEILADSDGAIIPHRLLNPFFEPSPPPPSLIVLPEYQPKAEPELESVSKARLTTLLMGCHVNARNLADHGFKEIIDIARSIPAYRLRYDRLEAAGDLLQHLLHG